MRHKAKHRGPVVTMLWNTALEVRTRVAVGAGARHKLSSTLAQIGAGKRVLVLCQASTAVHWLRDVLDDLPGEDFKVTTLEVPDGEACKSTDWLIRIWEHLQERGFDRHDTIVALGGGSVSDLAGFAASTYLRGLNLVIVPTSLLAQVDAAIGGKTAVNLPAGKNLAGTYFFPKAVLADQEMLSTVPRKQVMSAIGEILKYAMIEETVAKNSDYEMGPTPLIDVLEKIIKDGFDIEDPGISGLITSCIKMKLYIVARDPREANLRRILNLGHTVGHALEKVGDFKLSHGEAVGIGLVQTTKLSVAQKRIEKAAVERVKEILIRAELPHELPKGSNKEELVSTMAHDKKRHGENIKLVLPHTRLGMVDYEVSYPIADLNKLL
ncbi:3-dehydroquinate synthase [Candidatus Obscuribacterales bacterium]|nr:3-dehydroquinate synthase [Candidatus Obscuribacterales bacterium]MBX3136205.1 3-dehydroquinate synthase [Candidatus Obscuribacterales bacterium]MBX3148985.1 3-dehydroquinate synthase [Candidatus Obscuribacterales bacterium]